MNRINLLKNNLINKIAAGEVVERPASIVKELVENSIDSGATQITIEIKNGGISYIRVTDNGSGVFKEDIETAFLRHATSKISTSDDLDNISTLGFRGEALSSIASISKVEMITKTLYDSLGMKIEIEAGKIVTKKEIACINGTSIIIRNIFFNVPVRMKFLKKPSVECSYIFDLVHRFMLSNPAISFKFINNNDLVLQTNGNNDLKTAILRVYGKDTAKNLISINFEDNSIKITGFVGNAQISKQNRKSQNLFINGRFVKNSLIQSAIEKSYGTKLMTGKFPFFVINLNISFSEVDVNVHPSKIEIRFQDEDFIYKKFLEVISNTLNKEILIPEYYEDFIIVNNQKKDISFKESFLVEDEKIDEINEINIDDIDDIDEIDEKIDLEQKNNFFNKIELEMETYLPKIQKIDQINIDEAEISKNEANIHENTINSNINLNQNIQKKQKNNFFNKYNIIGNIFCLYWIIEQDDFIYIIDQHAAHEKILFEQLLKEFKSSSVISQKLLNPIIFDLDMHENQTIIDNKDLIFKFGFDLEQFGERTYALSAVPHIFKQPENHKFFLEILEKLSNIDSSITNIYDAKLEQIASISCKAAIKANNKLNFQEAKAIINDLLKLEEPFTCIHGRPTIISISKNELEKRFKRI